MVKKYKCYLKCRWLKSFCLRLIAILMCTVVIGAIVHFFMCSFGMYDTYVRLLLLFIIVVLLAIIAYLGYRMAVINDRYRFSLERLNLLLLRIKLDGEKDLATDKIIRELKLISRELAG